MSNRLGDYQKYRDTDDEDAKEKSIREFYHMIENQSVATKQFDILKSVRHLRNRGPKHFGSVSPKQNRKTPKNVNQVTRISSRSSCSEGSTSPSNTLSPLETDFQYAFSPGGAQSTPSMYAESMTAQANKPSTPEEDVRCPSLSLIGNSEDTTRFDSARSSESFNHVAEQLPEIDKFYDKSRRGSSFPNVTVRSTDCSSQWWLTKKSRDMCPLDTPRETKNCSVEKKKDFYSMYKFGREHKFMSLEEYGSSSARLTFIKNNDSSVPDVTNTQLIRPERSEWNLSDHGLGDSKLSRLAESIQMMQYLTAFSLKGNRLYGPGITNLLIKLNLPNLQLLDISQNPFGSDTKCVRQLCKFLKSCPILASLNLESCNLTESSGIRIARCLRHCTELRQLVLRNNKLGNTFAVELARTLAGDQVMLPFLEAANFRMDYLSEKSTNPLTGISNVSIPDLSRLLSSYSYGVVSGTDGVDGILESDKRLSRLNELDIAWNTFSATGLSVVLYSLRTHRIKVLDLSYNFLGHDVQQKERKVPQSPPASAGKTKPSSKSSQKKPKIQPSKKNSLTSAPRQAALNLLSTLFQDTSTLKHLNLSYTGINAADVDVFIESYNSNNTVFGLHAAGLPILIDAQGYISRVDKCNEQFAESVITSALKKKLDDTLVQIDPSSAEPTEPVYSAEDRVVIPAKITRVQSRTTSINLHRACWICATWREIEFIYRPSLSGPVPRENVRLYTSFDKWLPQQMEFDPKENVWRLIRMTPCATFFAVYEIDGNLKCSITDNLLYVPSLSIPTEDTGGGLFVPCTEPDFVNIFLSEHEERKEKSVVAPLIKRNSRSLFALNVDKSSWSYRKMAELFLPSDSQSSINDIHALSLFPSPLATIPLKDGTSLSKAQPRSDQCLKPPPQAFAWNHETCLFAYNIAETTSAYVKHVNCDLAKTRVVTLVKNKDDRQKVQSLLKSHAKLLRETFVKLCLQSKSPAEIFTVDPKAFFDFFCSSGLIDSESFTLKQAAKAVCMTASNQAIAISTGTSADEDMSMLPQFTRSAFLQGDSEEQSVVDLVADVINNHILPAHESTQEYENFRTTVLQAESVNLVMGHYQALLQLLWDTFCGEEEIKGSTNIGIRLWTLLLVLANLVDDSSFSLKLTSESFLLSKKLVEDEESTVAHKVLDWQEFCEAIVRFAYSYPIIHPVLDEHASLIHVLDSLTGLINPYSVHVVDSEVIKQACAEVANGNKSPWEYLADSSGI